MRFVFQSKADLYFFLGSGLTRATLTRYKPHNLFPRLLDALLALPRLPNVPALTAQLAQHATVRSARVQLSHAHSAVICSACDKLRLTHVRFTQAKVLFCLTRDAPKFRSHRTSKLRENVLRV
jgi:hypothetical protein